MSKGVQTVIALIAALAASAARAGALLLPEGQGQLIVTTTFADARNAYDTSGRLIKTPSYRKFGSPAMSNMARPSG